MKASLFLFACLLFQMPLLAQSQTALDSLIGLATAHSHEIKGLKIKQAQDWQQYTAEKKSWLSSFRIGMQFFSVEQQLGDNNPSPSIGLLPSIGGNLQLNLHQLLTTKQRVGMALGTWERTTEDIASAEDALAVWMAGKYLEHQSANKQRALLRQMLDAQEQQLLLLRVRFEKGEERIEAVLSQQQALLQTQEALLKAEIAVEKTRIEISIMTK